MSILSQRFTVFPIYFFVSSEFVQMIFAFNKIFTVILFFLNNTLQVEKFGIFKFF